MPARSAQFLPATTATLFLLYLTLQFCVAILLHAAALLPIHTILHTCCLPPYYDCLLLPGFAHRSTPRLILYLCTHPPGRL